MIFVRLASRDSTEWKGAKSVGCPVCNSDWAVETLADCWGGGCAHLLFSYQYSLKDHAEGAWDFESLNALIEELQAADTDTNGIFEALAAATIDGVEGVALNRPIAGSDIFGYRVDAS
jgi:hypothetical protein